MVLRVLHDKSFAPLALILRAAAGGISKDEGVSRDH